MMVVVECLPTDRPQTLPPLPPEMATYTSRLRALMAVRSKCPLLYPHQPPPWHWPMPQLLHQTKRNETKFNPPQKKEKEKQEKHTHLRSRTYTTVAELLPNFRSFQPSVAQRQNVHNTSTRNEARLIFVQNLNPRRKIRKTIPMLPPPA